jgi:zinc transport system substrate-binding protein
MQKKHYRSSGSRAHLRAGIGAAIMAAALFAMTAPVMGCAAKAKGAHGIVVAVSILPQQYFLERIGGDRVTALVLVGPGQNPHSYEPTPRQMASLAGARAWIKSGTDFELALEPKIRSQYPALRIVDGTAGVAFRELEKHSHEGEGADHDDDEPAVGNTGTDGAMPADLNIDRHTWLGREPAKIMAGWVRDTLIAIDPDGADLYRTNCAALVADIDREFDELKTRLAPLSGSKVFVFHPSFGYFLDEFGIKQEAVETGGKEPTAQALARLIDEAKRDKPSAIFVQAQFPVSAAKKIADAVGAKVVSLDPLAPDWLDNVKRIGDALEKNAK